MTVKWRPGATPTPAAANVACVKPLDTDVASNVTLVADSSRVWALPEWFRGILVPAQEDDFRLVPSPRG